MLFPTLLFILSWYGSRFSNLSKKQKQAVNSFIYLEFVQFGSFAEATCAALVIGSQGGLWTEWRYLAYPLTISAGGLIVCFLTSFVATHLTSVNEEAKIGNFFVCPTVVQQKVCARTLLKEEEVCNQLFQPQKIGFHTFSTKIFSLCVQKKL